MTYKDSSFHIIWAERLDKLCVIAGALVPTGLVIGNIGFEIMIGLVGGGWVIRLLLTRENPFKSLFKHPLVVPWIALLLSIAVSLVVNGPGGKGWAHDLVFFRFFLFGVALFEISNRKPVMKYLLWGLAAGVAWAVINTMTAYLLGFDLLGKPLIRYTGKLKEASRISGMTAYAAPLFFIWGILDKRLSPKVRKWVLLISVLAFIQLLQTHVRTAIIASLAGLVFSVFYYFRRRVPTKVAFGGVIALILVVILFFSFGGMWRLETVYDRVYYWKVTWTIWQEHPLVGVGISSFQDAYKEMAASGKVSAFDAPNGITYQLPEQTHAHNIIFMLLSSTGLFGLAAFCWLFINAVRMIFKRLEGARIALVPWPMVFLMIGITGFNIFHSWYQALFSFFAVLIGCSFSETEKIDVA